jgi:hypothetical protein
MCLFMLLHAVEIHIHFKRDVIIYTDGMLFYRLPMIFLLEKISGNAR